MCKMQRLFQWLSLSLILLILMAGCSSGLPGNTVPPQKTIFEEDSSKFKDIENKDRTEADDATLEVHFIDVGQGDCTLIICDGSSLLIDAGNNNKGTAVQLYLTKQGIEKLDYVIGTHPDADHIGGLDVILYKFDCGTVIMPDYTKDTRTYDDVVQTMKNKNYKITYPVVGATYTLGDAVFTIIAPNSKYGNNANDYSVGLILQHGSNKFVFTGDAEEESEGDILKNGIDISANVYKVSHHGSKTASTQAFLNAVNPEYAVISCGAGNSYGHPHAQTLNPLRVMGAQIFRTDEQGSIIATSDGEAITWNCSPSETWQVGEGKDSDKEDNVSEIDTDEEMIYIINVNTGKFHYPSCSGVESIKDKNRKESVVSKEELVNQGYLPCGRCKP